MAAGAKDIDIHLRIRATSKEGKRALDDFRRAMGEDVPDAAGKAQKSIGALQVALGSLIADGVKAAASALKDFAAESVGVFLDFEKVMTGVAKTTGLPKQEVQELGKELRNIAADIGPIMATDIGAIAEVAGQLGIASDKIKAENFAAAREEITAFTTVIGKAAIALPEFEGGAEQVATVTAKLLALYQENSTAAEQYLSVMNELANTTAANAAQISGFLEGFTIAPQLKITQDQAAALGATFVSLGQDAHDAATRMQSAYAMILKGSNKTDQALRDIFLTNSEMLTSLEQMSGVMLKGQTDANLFGDAMRKALGQDAIASTQLLIEALGKIEEPEKRMELAFAAFGQVGARTMSTLIGNTERLTTNLNTAHDAAAANISIQQEFETAISTQGAKFEELKSKVTDVQIEVGEHLTGALATVVATDINPLIDDFRTWMTTSEDARVLFQETLPQAIQLTVSAVRGVGAAFITIKNGLEIWGDAAGMTIGQVQEGWEQLERGVGAAGTKIGEAVGAVEEKVENLVTGFVNLKKQVEAAIDAVIAKIKAIPEAIDKAVGSVKNYGDAVKKSVTQNEKAIGVFQKLTDKIYGVEDALEGHSLTPAVERYTIATEEAGEMTNAFDSDLDDLGGTFRSIEGYFSGLADNLGTLSGGMGKLGGLFGIKELSGAGNVLGQIQQYAQVPQMLSDMGGALSGILSDVGGLGGVLSSLTGGFSGLGGAISGLLPTLGPIGLAGGAIALAWNPLKGLFKSVFGEARSEGNLAAESFRQYVASNVAGGQQLSTAMNGMYDLMKASGFDYNTFLAQVGTESHDALGGFSTDWEQGSTALDQFAVAIGTATGNMEKAPQVALQTVGAMQSMGMTTEQVTAQVEAMTQSIMNTGTVGPENVGALSQAYLDQIPNINETYDATEKLRSSIEQIPREIQIQTKFLAFEGNAPPGMARGGIIPGGPAIVGERGPEGAIFPGGGRGIVGLQGPELQLFPAGTQIISNTQLSSFLKAIPHMAGGGTVESMPFMRDLVINVYPPKGRDFDERRLAEFVMQEIARKIRPYMR